MPKYSDEEFIKIVKESLSIAAICRVMNMKPAGGNYRTLKTRIKELSLNTSHFTGQGWNIGDRYVQVKQGIPLKDILVPYSTFSVSHLSKRLLKEGIKENRCESCDLDTWLDEPIKLELHHIDGVSTNHSIENLLMLCPNCHSYTDNYRGKNIKDAPMT